MGGGRKITLPILTVGVMEILLTGSGETSVEIMGKVLSITYSYIHAKLKTPRYETWQQIRQSSAD